MSPNVGGASTRMQLGADPIRIPRGSERRVPDANIAKSLRAMAKDRPDDVCVMEPVGKEPSGAVRYATWTFAELDREVDRLCHALATTGLERGMRTVLMVPPSRSFYALSFALFRLGAVPVLVDPGMGVKSLRACLDRAAPTAFIGVPKAHLARVLLGWARPSVKIRVTVGKKGPWRGPTLAAIRHRAPMHVRYDGPETRADETAAILFTSGSTGTPKGAVYHHAIFLEQVAQLARLYAIEPGEIDLPTFPLFGLFDVALGMTAVIPEMDFTRPGQADPEKLITAMTRFSVTNLFASPALLKNLARFGEKNSRRLPHLRRVLSAGAPVPAEEIARLAALLDEGVEVHTPYGATESLPVSTIGSGEIIGETAKKTRAGGGVCVGRPVEGVDVRVIAVHDEPIETLRDDLSLPTGEIGEICVRGPIVSRSYFDHPEGTALAKVADPTDSPERLWHRMGDLGRFDEQGRLWFQGRKAHRVWTAKGPLDTIAVEGVFNAHPQVARTALVGLGKRGSQIPLLCVELEAGVTVDEKTLFSELRTLGRAVAHTKGIEFFRLHPSFPVDIRHNAKIFREKLTIWAGSTR